MLTTERSKPAAQPSADVQVSTAMANDLHREMPMDHAISLFVKAQPEAWRQAHLVCRDDRQHGNVVSLTAQALDTLALYVATYTDVLTCRFSASLSFFYCLMRRGDVGPELRPTPYFSTNVNADWHVIGEGSFEDSGRIAISMNQRREIDLQAFQGRRDSLIALWNTAPRRSLVIS